MATASNTDEFKLIGPRQTEQQSGSEVTLSCHLSPELSAVTMEIRWFKGTDCVCLYKNRQVTEGRGYEGRVSLFTQELQRGNVSLQIRDCRESDTGAYLCQVTDGDTTKECTMNVEESQNSRGLKATPARAAESDSKDSWDDEDTDPEQVVLAEPQNLRRDLSLQVDEVFIVQSKRKWKKEERKKMTESVLLTEKAHCKVNMPSRDALQGVISSASSEGFHSEHSSMAAAVKFIPEMAEDNSETKSNYSYRFLCPHAGQFQCSLTNLVFEMEGKGEVFYRIDSWDPRVLEGLGDMQPAGPLYSIDCFEGSLSHLHLPHCETEYEENQLVVAHLTHDNAEIIQPANITVTHVIISIQGFSSFGILDKLFRYRRPINAQVLLFYKEMMDKQSRTQLHIHLLPGNVPVKEVEKNHSGASYFDTSSACKLIPGRKYKPFCDPYVSQPKAAKFRRDYGPNYHPMFVVYLKAEEVTVSLRDEQDEEVWEPRQVLLTAEKPGLSTETSPLTMEAAADFVDKWRKELIERVSSVMEIADCLRSKDMITAEMYSTIQTTTPSQEQMRTLYRFLESGGAAVKVEFYKALKQKLPFLVDELEAGSSKAWWTS